MRLVCSPDSLKGVLSASAAASALAGGARRAGAEATELPLADGGEGTADVLHAVWGGAWRTATVCDALGRPHEARYLWVEDRRLAVVESAEAIGLPLLMSDEQDPLRTSSEGLGRLILEALDAGARELLVTLGGSATVDGGAGLRRVLAPADLESIRLTVLCDVTNPLHGPRGAARAFGPQKGASSQDIVELERRLLEMSELDAYADQPGAGAAGGLGAALALLGANLASGAAAVLDAIEFGRRIGGADLVVTGEGKVDTTSLEGKIPVAVAAACAQAGVPCVVFGGVITVPAEELYDRGATALLALSGEPAEASHDLAELGYALARLVSSLKRC